MSAEKIITIVSFALAVAAFAWGLYQKVKGNATEASSEFIAQVESTGLLGPEKMALVVSWLYDMVPAPFKKFLDQEALKNLAQKIFDYMKRYTNAYIEAHNGKGKEAYNEVNDDLASDVAEKLSGLGTVGLKALALNMGIDITGKTDAELIKAIVYLIMEKA